MASARKKMSQLQISPQDEDDESYWNESSSLKPFDFNADFESDSINVVGWDGTAVNSQPSRPQSQQSGGSITSARPPAASARPPAASARAYSSRSVRNSDLPAPTSRLTSTQSTGVSSSQQYKGSAKSSASSHQSFSELSGMNTKPTTTELVSLEAKVRTLERQLAECRKSAEKAPSVGETLRQLMAGDPFVLELYKSRADKCTILDKAIERCDGNAILATTLFMRNTLKRDLFSKELMSRPAAMDHYCSYLRASGEIDELHETLSALGKTEEAAILKYKHTLSTTSNSSPSIRANALKDCIRFYFEPDRQLTAETALINEEIHLMERQVVVDDIDKKAQEQGTNPIFKTHPRSGSIIYKPVTTTLNYSCCYHWGEKDNILSSPISIKEKHNINQKQWEYSVVDALCWRKSWTQLKAFFQAPQNRIQSTFGWSATNRLQAAIGFDKVVEVLTYNNAHADIISEYCGEISSNEKRLETAQKFCCYKQAIDTLVLMRNRQGLQSYIPHIPKTMNEMVNYANNKLRSDVKWRN